MSDQLIDVFIEKWLDFDLEIREKKGLNEALYKDLIGLLREIKNHLNGKRDIPKSLAEIFLDMWGAMTSSADLYEVDMKKRVYEAADQLTCQAREICSS
ncbi:hypothetical protein VLK31_21370 [Variovorax sp. H27-G14]|uniref:hypothetical protein n=1 Tax=Variovorax sp. H27-G14 TaxID=3111914 RepID=UPI0038FD158D